MPFVSDAQRKYFNANRQELEAQVLSAISQTKAANAPEPFWRSKIAVGARPRRLTNMTAAVQRLQGAAPLSKPQVLQQARSLANERSRQGLLWAHTPNSPQSELVHAAGGNLAAAKAVHPTAAISAPVSRPASVDRSPPRVQVSQANQNALVQAAQGFANPRYRGFDADLYINRMREAEQLGKTNAPLWYSGRTDVPLGYASRDAVKPMIAVTDESVLRQFGPISSLHPHVGTDTRGMSPAQVRQLPLHDAQNVEWSRQPDYEQVASSPPPLWWLASHRYLRPHPQKPGEYQQLSPRAFGSAFAKAESQLPNVSGKTAGIVAYLFGQK